jgi:hypothetical protein
MIKIFIPTKKCSWRSKPFIHFGLDQFTPDVEINELKFILIFNKLKFIYEIKNLKVYELIKKTN